MKRDARNFLSWRKAAYLATSSLMVAGSLPVLAQTAPADSAGTQPAAATAAADATAASAPQPATAAAAPGAGDTQEVVVTGIRGSLNRALNVKREAASIVDAVSAEDVGKFPDINIAESMQRITGVQINRTRGEGRTVNIRGLPANFTLTTLNGRTLPNAISDANQISNRTFDFSIMAPEFVRTLEVYKSPTADLEDGGLAGTVDVKTPHALDARKRILAASAEGSYDDNSGKIGPRVSGLFADTFFGDRVGVTLGLSYLRRRGETNNAQFNWTTGTESAGIPSGGGPDDLNGDGIIEPNLTVRIPASVFYSLFHEDEKRLSAIGSLEYQATDSLRLTLDGFYSKLDVGTTAFQYFNSFNNAATVSGATVQTLEGVPTTTSFSVNKLDLRGLGRYEDRHGYIGSAIATAHYERDHWTAELSGSYSNSRQHRNNLALADASNIVSATYTSEPGDEISSTVYTPDAARLDPKNFKVVSLNGEFQRHSSDQLRDVKLDVKREFDSSFLKSIKFGAKYTSRAFFQDNNNLTITAANVSKLVGGLPVGPAPGTFSAASFMQLVSPTKGAYLGAYKGDAVFPTSWLSTNTKALLSDYTNADLTAVGTVTNDPTGITNVTERTMAAYVRGDWETGALSGNLGLRVVKTWQQSTGVSGNYNSITVAPESAFVVRIPVLGTVNAKNDYIDYLPSMNVKWDVARHVVARFSASRTVTRPNLADISPSAVGNYFSLTISQNNPYLQPFRSNNVDGTVEWYFGKSGVVGGSLFYKDLASLIRPDITVQTLQVTFLHAAGNVVSPVNFNVARLVNGKGVTLKGVELYYQQGFSFLPAPFDGLGTILNYTYIDNSDPLELTAASKHNFNAVGYYEKGPVSFRLSYAWRDSFLSLAPQPPVMGQRVKAFGSLDGSFSLKLTHAVQLTFEATNLLNKAQITQYTTGLPEEYTDSGRRFFGGIRATF